MKNSEPKGNLPLPVQCELIGEEIKNIYMTHTVLITLKDGSIRKFVYCTGSGWRKV